MLAETLEAPLRRNYESHLNLTAEPRKTAAPCVLRLAFVHGAPFVTNCRSSSPERQDASGSAEAHVIEPPPFSQMH